MTNKPAYKCDQCSHKTIYRANLSKHKQVIHQQKINQCDRGVPDRFFQFLKSYSYFICIKATFETQNKLIIIITLVSGS